MLTLVPSYPAAFVKTQKTTMLVIADLHIGWEIALSEKGIHVPAQMPKLLRKLKDLISFYKPEKLLVLGDIKHTIARAEIGEWQDVPHFFNKITEVVPEVCIIRGNHDGNLEPLLPEKIKILPATEAVIEGIGFFHGHRWPSPALLKCETLVMGHVHPVVVFRDPAGFRITRQVWIRADCDGVNLAKVLLQRHKIRIENSIGETLMKYYKIKPRTRQLFIIPSFNELLGGRPLNERKTSERIVGPVLRSDAVDIDEAEAYLLDGTFLGTLRHLKNLS